MFRLRAGLTVLLGSCCLAPAAAEVTLLSRAAVPAETAAGHSFPPGVYPRSLVSGDNRYVAFLSLAANLVSGQINTNPAFSFNAFLFDRQTGTSRLLSRKRGTTATAVGVTQDTSLSVSRDGSCALFTSASTEIVPGQADTNDNGDVFLYDVATGHVTLVSHAAGAPATAGNGSSGPAWALAVSHDCRYVAYASLANNLVAGQIDTPGTPDVFLYDRLTNTNTLVSHQAGAATTASNGFSVRPALSGDGRFVAFTSAGTNLALGQIDTNGADDAFLFDRTTGGITLVSHVSHSPFTTASSSPDVGGGVFQIALSGDGGFVAYSSTADGLVAGHVDPNDIEADIYLFDRTTGETLLASRSAASPVTSGDVFANPFLTPAISDDGRHVVFASAATNLVPGQVDEYFQGTGLSYEDIFLFDRVTRATTLITHTGRLSASLVAGNGATFAVQISGDGHSVAFYSQSPLGYSENPGGGVFLFRRDTGGVTVASHVSGDPNVVARSGAFGSALSPDGRFVVYESGASDLVSPDTNGVSDVFVYDRSSGGNAVISRRAADMPSLTGGAGNQASETFGPVLSADGRHATFVTHSAELFPSFSPQMAPQVVVADRLRGTLRPGNPLPGCPSCPGTWYSYSPTLSSDGSRLAFLVGAPVFPGSFNRDQVYSYDFPAQSLRLVSHAAALAHQPSNDGAYFPVTSADGGTIAFESRATDLVEGTDINGEADIFVQPPGGPIRLVSHVAGSPTVAANWGSSGPRISADGRYVAFNSQAFGLVSGFLDTNGSSDVFLYDLDASAALLVSRSAAGGAANGASFLVALSADGRFVLFRSTATNLVAGQVDSPGSGDLFLFDRGSGETLLVTRVRGTLATAAGLHGTTAGGLSADGRYSAFWSLSQEIIAGQVDAPETPDLFLFDRLTGEMTLVSRTAASMVAGAHGTAVSPQLSADGRFVVWVSDASNVIAGQIDTNESGDVFVFDRQTGTNRLVSRAMSSPVTAARGASADPAISADGRSILFSSTAGDLVAQDFNSTVDLFLDRAPTTPGAFFTVPPCRIADSRVGDTPLSSSIPRTLALHAACGVPSTATAVSVNLTVVAGGSAGFATLFPGDQPVPATSTLNFRAGQVKANNAVARLALDGSGTLGIVASFGDGPVHVILDVNGYFE